MAKKDSTSVSIAGLSDGRSIAVTFTITLNGIFLLYNLFLTEKQSKVYLDLIFLKVSPFLQILNTAVTLPNPYKWSKKLSFHRWIWIFSLRKYNFGRH